MVAQKLIQRMDAMTKVGYESRLQNTANKWETTGSKYIENLEANYTNQTHPLQSCYQIIHLLTVEDPSTG